MISGIIGHIYLQLSPEAIDLNYFCDCEQCTAIYKFSKEMFLKQPAHLPSKRFVYILKKGV